MLLSFHPSHHVWQFHRSWDGGFPPCWKQSVMHGRMGLRVKGPLVSSRAQHGTLIKGSRATADPRLPVCTVKAVSSEKVGATSCCWPNGEYSLKWLDYVRVKWSALMSYFDVVRLVVPHSGLTIVLIGLTVTVCRASTQAPSQARLKPAALFLHAHPSAWLHRHCSVYFPKKWGLSSTGRGYRVLPALCVSREISRKDSCLAAIDAA